MPAAPRTTNVPPRRLTPSMRSPRTRVSRSRPNREATLIAGSFTATSILARSPGGERAGGTELGQNARPYRWTIGNVRLKSSSAPRRTAKATSACGSRWPSRMPSSRKSRRECAERSLRQCRATSLRAGTPSTPPRCSSRATSGGCVGAAHAPAWSGSYGAGWTRRKTTSAGSSLVVTPKKGRKSVASAARPT